MRVIISQSGHRYINYRQARVLPTRCFERREKYVKLLISAVGRKEDYGGEENKYNVQIENRLL